MIHWHFLSLPVWCYCRAKCYADGNKEVLQDEYKYMSEPQPRDTELLQNNQILLYTLCTHGSVMRRQWRLVCCPTSSLLLMKHCAPQANVVLSHISGNIKYRRITTSFLLELYKFIDIISWKSTTYLWYRSLSSSTTWRLHGYFLMGTLLSP